MSKEASVKETIMEFVEVVDLFDKYPHKLLHQTAEEFTTWCEMNLSPEGTQLLIRFFQSIPCGFSHSTKDVLNYLRERYDYRG